MGSAQYFLVNDWTILTGATVEIRQGRQLLRQGVVEEFTSDGKVVWLQQGQGFGRQLVDKGSGFTIHISEEQIKSIGKLQ